MFFRLGELVARRWWLVILLWVAAAGAMRWVAPPWDSVTYDGDLAYLPDRSPSVVGESLLARAFPHDHAKSQLVVIIARSDGPLEERDIYVSYDVGRRMQWLHGIAALERLRRLDRELQSSGDAAAQPAAEMLARRLDLAKEEARQALDEAAYFDQQLVEYRRGESAVEGVGPIASLAPIYWHRAMLAEYLGDARNARVDRQKALAIDLDVERVAQAEAALSLPILDAWTWRDAIFGGKLISDDRQARLVVLRISNEFLAVRNQEMLAAVHKQLAAVRATLTPRQREVLTIQTTGSAAIGGDMLLSAKESIQNTEWFTVLLIVLILVVVYRAPLLVLLPLVSIAVSLVVATNLVAWLADPARQPGSGAWWGFKVFTTTRIFIVVILFGAGTDYCLFLIARFREELAQHGHARQAIARALAGVGDALSASALTTIVGLAMMYFSDFGKFRYSGPVIGLCLSVALLVCLTLTPALLVALGRRVFWPFQPDRSAVEKTRDSLVEGIWRRIAEYVASRPARVLTAALVLLLPPAWYGARSADHVTYDVLAGLDASRPSRIGTRAMRAHFPVGESGPVTVVLHRPGADFASEAGRRAIYDLTKGLYATEGVGVVRSIIDPLGEYPPGQTIGLTNRRAWATWLARPHRKTEAVFVARTPEFPGDLTRIDVILQHDPFSNEALRTLREIEVRLQEATRDPASYWHDCEIAFAGPTASVRDLKEVTLVDRQRIEWLVVLAVYAVLVVILRRPLICVYLILSVLLTYFVTMGATEMFFRWVYGPTYEGLDWKVPIFLFVILVAVGQDYNVYLATRVFEEQQRRGPFAGLRDAVVRTGGIITSCGIIMAGTFIAMTSVAWGACLPESWTWLRRWIGDGGGLRGMVELGFALALGVLIDTLVVRPILVPAFLALVSHVGLRRQAGASRGFDASVERGA